MNDIVIQCERIGKRYAIGEREPYRALRDTLTDALYAPARRLRALLRGGSAPSAEMRNTTFWALQDVSFEVRRGEVLGIIGRNGAGKSTLLKILSRITKPTVGCARVRGRVGSLLEVGTGFHPELTGRENIYLNGAILGMRKADIDRKFEAIVEFAEVERFIDTPVKRYSSGMYVRLAFAVAAHLDTEILLVDEVLAVGDIAFQRKCLGMMGDVARSGRTVLLVSHNIVAVEHLCTSALLLDGGRVARRGATDSVVEEYLRTASGGRASSGLKSRSRPPDHATICLVASEIVGADGSTGAVVRSGDCVRLRMYFECRARVARPVFSLAITTLVGQRIFVVHSTDLGMTIDELEADGYFELEIPRLNLMPGSYLLDFAIGDEMEPHRYDLVLEGAQLDVEAADVYGSGKVTGAGWSLIFFDCKGRLETASQV